MNDQAASTGLLRAMPWVFVVIWSTGFIVARYGMPYGPPMTFLVWRYVLSIVCFLVWIVLARVTWPVRPVQWLHLAVSGVLMHAGYLGGVWAAVKAGMGAGLVSLMVGLQPVLTALWLSSRGGQVSARQWGGLWLGLAGLVLVVWRKFGPAGEAQLLNMGLATLALLSITTGTLYQKHFVTACDVRSANAIQLTAALVVTLPLAMLETEPMAWLLGSAWNWELVLALAWSVLGLTRRGRKRQQPDVPGAALHGPAGLAPL